jgi:hypothetical protein
MTLSLVTNDLAVQVDIESAGLSTTKHRWPPFFDEAA